jgi:hypothetical protein
MKHKLHLPAVPKVPKLKMPEALRLGRRKKDIAARYVEAVETLPDITNTTVAEHREKVLSSARKYIYPLRHSKHRIVTVSVTLLAAVVIGFFIYCGSALYKFQSTNGFLYGITRIIPFPVAKAGSDYVAYENYLFELRHYTHYYETQQAVNFNTTAGKEQLASYKKQALQQVIDDAYVKQLAVKNHISVSDEQVNNEVTLVRQEDHLGNNEKEFEVVLNQFWGWSLNDFKRELKTQLLAQQVADHLDTATHNRAQAALSALQGGADFGVTAGQYSDDTATKGNGGQFGFAIDNNTQNLPPQTLNTLLNLKPGQTSGIIDIGTGLEIDKVISNSGGQIQAAHILFNFQPISTYLTPFEQQHKTHRYIKLPS